MRLGDEALSQCQDAGFHSTTHYNIVGSGKTSANLTEDYEDLIVAHTSAWKALAKTSLPYCPTVTMGWDNTPRLEHNVPMADYHAHVVVGNTPERFGRLCKLAADHAAADPKRPPAVFVNAWNEWTEGSYLLPERRHGTAYLAALQAAFRRP